MRFAAVFAIAAISVCAIPIADNTVVSAATDALANVDTALANVAVKGSDVADNIANDNHISVLPRGSLVDIGVVIEALANALDKVDVSLEAVLANVKVQDSSVLTNILNDNDITIFKRSGLVLPDNIDAIILAFIDALVAAGVDVNAALANINIDQSTLLSNLGNNNVIFVRSLPETVDIVALVKALANAAAAVGVDVNAIIANLNIDNSSILTNILNGNTIVVGRRDLPFTIVNADILAVLLALVQAALDANVNVIATVANVGLDVVSILSNILNNNTITVLPIFARNASALDVYSTVLALVQALAAINIPVDANALDVFIQNSNIATNVLNNNIISILGL